MSFLNNSCSAASSSFLSSDGCFLSKDYEVGDISKLLYCKLKEKNASHFLSSSAISLVDRTSPRLQQQCTSDDPDCGIFENAISVRQEGTDSKRKIRKHSMPTEEETENANNGGEEVKVLPQGGVSKKRQKRGEEGGKGEEKRNKLGKENIKTKEDKREAEEIKTERAESENGQRTVVPQMDGQIQILCDILNPEKCKQKAKLQKDILSQGISVARNYQQKYKNHKISADNESHVEACEYTSAEEECNKINNTKKNEEYQPQKTGTQSKEKQSEENKRTIFVSNLPLLNCKLKSLAKILKIDLKDIEKVRYRCASINTPLKRCGKLRRIVNCQNMSQNAYIVLRNDNLVFTALEANGLKYKNRRIRVDKAEKKNDFSVFNRKQTIFLGNLSPKVDEDALIEFCEQVAAVKAVRIIRDKKFGNSKGFGFALYEKRENVKKALGLLNGKILMDHPIRVTKVLSAEEAKHQKLLKTKDPTFKKKDGVGMKEGVRENPAMRRIYFKKMKQIRNRRYNND